MFVAVCDAFPSVGSYIVLCELCSDCFPCGLDIGYQCDYVVVVMGNHVGSSVGGSEYFSEQGNAFGIVVTQDELADVGTYSCE